MRSPADAPDAPIAPVAPDAPDAPAFRDWLLGEDNQPEADALIARFVLDEGVELVLDLLGCRGEQHQWAAERWVAKLGEEFERWWD